MASYPSAVVTFPTRSNGQTIDASHINAIQDEVTAIESGLLNGTAPLTSSNASVARLTVSSNLQVTGNSTFSANLNIAGASTVTSDLAVGGNLAVTGNLQVAAASSLASNVNIGGQLALSGAFVMGGIQNSTFSGGNTDNLTLGSSVMYLRISPSANSTITGVTGAGGVFRLMLISNVGTANAHLPHNNAGSISSNRWLVANSVGSTLIPGSVVWAVYDATAWRLVTV